MTDSSKNQLVKLVNWFQGTMDHVPDVAHQGQFPLTLSNHEQLKSHINCLKWEFGFFLSFFVIFGGLFGGHSAGFGGFLLGIMLTCSLFIPQHLLF
jgi:hypothetical protein